MTWPVHKEDKSVQGKRCIWIMHAYHEVIEDYGFVEELGVQVVCFKDRLDSIMTKLLGFGVRRLALAASTSGPWHYWHYSHYVTDKIPKYEENDLGLPKGTENINSQKHWLGVLTERARTAYWDKHRAERQAG